MHQQQQEQAAAAPGADQDSAAPARPMLINVGLLSSQLPPYFKLRQIITHNAEGLYAVTFCASPADIRGSGPAGAALAAAAEAAGAAAAAATAGGDSAAGVGLVWGTAVWDGTDFAHGHPVFSARAATRVCCEVLNRVAAARRQQQQQQPGQDQEQQPDEAGA